MAGDRRRLAFWRLTEGACVLAGPPGQAILEEVHRAGSLVLVEQALRELLSLPEGELLRGTCEDFPGLTVEVILWSAAEHLCHRGGGPNVLQAYVTV